MIACELVNKLPLNQYELNYKWKTINTGWYKLLVLSFHISLKHIFSAAKGRLYNIA